jgi:hypothetical protein
MRIANKNTHQTEYNGGGHGRPLADRQRRPANVVAAVIPITASAIDVGSGTVVASFGPMP